MVLGSSASAHEWRQGVAQQLDQQIVVIVVDDEETTAHFETVGMTGVRCRARAIVGQSIGMVRVPKAALPECTRRAAPSWAKSLI